jgi:hypothetical protein
MFQPIIISNIDSHFFNFKFLLNIQDTIIWRNCNNIKIKIKSKINKLIFENCNDIIIQFYDAIIGIEFNRCNNVYIIIKNHINLIESYKSNIVYSIKKHELNKIVFITEQSYIKKISKNIKI